MSKTGVIFSGQGAQFAGMGKDLAAAQAEAAALFRQADELLQNGFQEVCFNGPAETLTDTSYCQPALFVHGLSLLAVLQKLRPDWRFQATAGLSLGEFTAHTAAGHFRFADGLQLVATRGRLMQEACRQTKGGMLSLIGATAEQALALAAATDLEVANYNCPGQIVLSGAADRIAAAAEQGKALGLKRALPLKVAGAYHSRLMLSAQEGLRPALDGVTVSASTVAVYSNVTGKRVIGNAEIKDTLLRQVTGSVRWQDCVEEMIRDGVTQFIELGPGKVLAGMCKRINPNIPVVSIGSLDELTAAAPTIP
ncbi:MAG: ACP S-malonyltransferase [Verrucomicrobiales bacterium]|jgi:[acyl-carrier-protein] S-malonyltransferase|nr:ACP S-malonyltransferase [Verrucomicrobiales bacterium]